MEKTPAKSRKKPVSAKSATKTAERAPRVRKPAPAKHRPKKKSRRKKKVRLGIGAMLAIAAVALGIAASVVLATRNHGRSGSRNSGAVVPEGNWRYGIDISHNNEGRIVWDSLYVMTDANRRTVRDPFKAKEIKPVSFVFIKATEGATFKDKDFKQNWKKAGQAGLRRGAYHFFRSSRDGEVQARHFIRTVGDLRLKDLPPVLDIETIHKGCSRKLLNERALQWLKAVEKHYGRKPVVYSGASFAKDYLCREIRENYPIWIAHYTKKRPAYEGWTWWQFTDQAIVSGVPNPVDLSVEPIQQTPGKRK